MLPSDFQIIIKRKTYWDELGSDPLRPEMSRRELAKFPSDFDDCATVGWKATINGQTRGYWIAINDGDVDQPLVMADIRKLFEEHCASEISS